MMLDLPFPEWIDSTLLDAFSACERKGFYEGFKRLRLANPSIHLHAGAAFAAGLEMARRHYFIDHAPVDEAEAVGLRHLLLSYGDREPPEASNKTWDGMARALVAYFDRWPLDRDYLIPALLGDQRAIEFTFSIPLPIPHPTTGQPILFSGRCDAIVKFQNAHWILDEKTTRSIGGGWPEQWRLRGQFIGYCWAASQYGIPVNGAIVRGVSILKDHCQTAEVIQPYGQHLIGEWLRRTEALVRRMIQAWEAGYFLPDFGHSCSSYGGCPFAVLCDKENPEPWEQTYFQPSTWDPLKKCFPESNS